MSILNYKHGHIPTNLRFFIFFKSRRMESNGNESMDAITKSEHMRPMYLDHYVSNFVHWDLQQPMFQGPRESMD